MDHQQIYIWYELLLDLVSPSQISYSTACALVYIHEYVSVYIIHVFNYYVWYKLIDFQIK